MQVLCWLPLTHKLLYIQFRTQPLQQTCKVDAIAILISHEELHREANDLQEVTQGLTTPSTLAGMTLISAMKGRGELGLGPW